MNSKADMHLVQGPVLQAWPADQCIAVTDSCTINDNAGYKEYVELCGARRMLLPAHCPDMNPVRLHLGYGVASPSASCSNLRHS